MTITSTNIAKTSKRIGDTAFKRFVAPSGGNIHETILDFLMDIDTDILSLADLERMETLLYDLAWLSQKELNEASHFSKKSTTVARIKSRKWYLANKSRVKKLQARIKKSKGLRKKKEIMSKSGRTLTKKQKKKYNTKGHVNEKKPLLPENVQRQIKLRSAETVSRMFSPHRYRVIKSFKLNEDIEANLYELVLHFGNNTYQLEKRDGRNIKFETEDIKPFIKLENLVDIEDILKEV